MVTRRPSETHTRWQENRYVAKSQQCGFKHSKCIQANGPVGVVRAHIYIYKRKTNAARARRSFQNRLTHRQSGTGISPCRAVACPFLLSTRQASEDAGSWAATMGPLLHLAPQSRRHNAIPPGTRSATGHADLGRASTMKGGWEAGKP